MVNQQCLIICLVRPSIVCSGAQSLWKLLSHQMIISDGDVVWSGHCVQRQQTHETIFLKTILKKEPTGKMRIYISFSFEGARPNDPQTVSPKNVEPPLGIL